MELLQPLLVLGVEELVVAPEEGRLVVYDPDLPGRLVEAQVVVAVLDGERVAKHALLVLEHFF